MTVEDQIQLSQVFFCTCKFATVNVETIIKKDINIYFCILQETKVVMLEDLAGHFKLKTQVCIIHSTLHSNISDTCCTCMMY